MFKATFVCPEPENKITLKIPKKSETRLLWNKIKNCAEISKTTLNHFDLWTCKTDRARKKEKKKKSCLIRINTRSFLPVASCFYLFIVP